MAFDQSYTPGWACEADLQEAGPGWGGVSGHALLGGSHASSRTLSWVLPASLPEPASLHPPHFIHPLSWVESTSFPSRAQQSHVNCLRSHSSWVTERGPPKARGTAAGSPETRDLPALREGPQQVLPPNPRTWTKWRLVSAIVHSHLA